jgi:hypothetical protein
MSNVRPHIPTPQSIRSVLEGAIALYTIYGGAALGLAVGLIYYRWSDPNANSRTRWLASAFGPSISLLFVAAVVLPDRFRFRSETVELYLGMQILPLSLLLFTLVRFPGPRKAHIFLVPAGLLAWAWTFALGWTFIHGK